MSFLLLVCWLHTGCSEDRSTDTAPASLDMSSVPVATDVGFDVGDMKLDSADIFMTQSCVNKAIKTVIHSVHILVARSLIVMMNSLEPSGVV